MKFFTTSEASGVASDTIRPARNLLEDKIKALVDNKNYGSGVNYWGHIIICNPAEFYENGFLKEIKKYTRKEAEVELRLRIDYESIIQANKKGVTKLLCKSYLDGINIAENELKITNFDFAAFRKDLTNLFKKEGLI